MEFEKEINAFLLYCKNNSIDLYLVGGASRDYLLNKSCYDLDFCLTSNYLKAYTLLNETYKCKKDDKYQCIKFEINNYNIEISHARKEKGYLDYRHPDIIEFCDDIKEDSKRRDFTINAIYYKDNEIYDFYNGMDDLKNKRLRVIGDTLTRFKEDPLRILRMIRFSCLGFKINDKDKRVILDNLYLLKELKEASFNKEFDKILEINNLEIIYEYKEVFEEYFNIKITNISLMKYLDSIEEKKTYLGIKNKSNIYKYKDIVLENNRNHLTKLIYKFGKDLIKEIIEYNDKIKGEKILHLYSDIIENDFYSKNQLDITSESIIDITRKKELTSYYIDTICYAIIDNKLENKENKIIEYILEKIK